MFSEVKSKLTSEIENYIDNLEISNEKKEELKKYYKKVWDLVTSGEIKLELDLHFEQNNIKYNIDFKSGFSSNEKGNTNRLLLVSTIYKNLEDNYENILLVRANENRNNNYFQTLKNSGVWNAFCGDETYSKFNDFTGFNLKNWIDTNVNWQDDFNSETIQFLTENGLSQYLIW